MKAFLLDSNHMGEATTPVSEVRERIQLARRRGIRFGTCVPVLCELEAGWQASRRHDDRRIALEQLLRQVAIWPLEKRLAPIFGKVFQEAKAKGKVLSQVDMILAAMARLHGLTILTADKDFAVFPDIRVENWLK